MIQDGKFMLKLVKRLNHADPSSEEGLNVNSAITCILPMAQTVYTGDEDGRVVSQSQAQAVHVTFSDMVTVSMGLHTKALKL